MLDYISFTVDINTESFNLVRLTIKDILNIDVQNEKIKNGIHFYSYRIHTDYLTVLYGGQNGIHFQLSSTQLERIGEKQVKYMIAYVIENECKVTRIDLCKDFEYDFEFFLEAVKNNRYFSRSHNFCTVLDKNNRGTIYIGSRKSSTFVRIYDKALEQGLKEKYWVRYEVEFKKEKCTKELIMALYDNDYHYLSAIMNSVFHVKINNKPREKTISPIWQYLMTTMEIIKLKIPKKERNYAKWFYTIVMSQVKNLLKTYTMEDVKLIVENKFLKSAKTEFFIKHKKHIDTVQNFEFWDDSFWLREKGWVA